MQPPTLELPAINERNHAITRFIMGRMERYLHLHLRLHGLSDQFAYGGGIVVANHFTRLETFLIPFILHRALGKTVRILAAPALFANKTVGDYLRSLGGLPANYPNKYELIAGDILHGGWWLIFPEGSMVKDRKVVEHGRFYVAAEAGTYRRRPRSGAAILALMVQQYKDALRQGLQQKQDLETICATLGLRDMSHTALAAVAHSPTAIVPLNVTYYPLNPQDNALKSLITLLLPKLPDSALGQRILEELTVEGSMLLKGIEVDFRLGSPLIMETGLDHTDNWRVVPWSASPWRRYLNLMRQWRTTQQYTHLLDRWAAWHGWRQRRRAWHATRTSLQALYNLTTVNIDHLLSALLLLGLRKDKQQRFAVADVKRRIYLIVQSLQALGTVHLHPVLTDPDLQYTLLTDTPHASLESFVQRAVANALLRCDDDTWVLATDLLTREWSFGTVRIENFIQVYFNEIEPLTDVLQAVHRAMRADLSRQQTRFGDDRFAYEQQLYDEEYTAFATQDSAKLSSLAYNIGRPVLRRGMGTAKSVGVLLIHGYSASPGEMLPLADCLQTHGFTVHVIRLRGHGTSPYDLQQWGWQDWYHSVLRGYHNLRAISDTQFVGGMSIGGALALYLAAQQETTLQGVFAVGAPIKLQNRFVHLAPILKTVKNFIHAEPENSRTNYNYHPLQAVQQLLQFIDEYQTVLPHITLPVLLIQARSDPTVWAESAQVIYDRIQSQDKQLLWKDIDRHVIVSANYPEVHTDIVTFLQQRSSLADQAAARSPV